MESGASRVLHYRSNQFTEHCKEKRNYKYFNFLQKEMYSSLLSALPDLIKQMEQQEYIANRKFIEKMKQKQLERKDKSKIQIFLEE